MSHIRENAHILVLSSVQQEMLKEEYKKENIRVILPTTHSCSLQPLLLLRLFELRISSIVNLLHSSLNMLTGAYGSEFPSLTMKCERDSIYLF